jgi:hypothetical protein
VRAVAAAPPPTCTGPANLCGARCDAGLSLAATERRALRLARPASAAALSRRPAPRPAAYPHALPSAVRTPQITNKKTTPEGVLFVAHGCNHAATDWLPKSDACPRCTGLPEETNITRTALRRGIAVVAVSSAARRSHRCWDLSKGSRDFQQARESKRGSGGRV